MKHKNHKKSNGLDAENHSLQKVYINDNVTCIRRLSSVNFREISGCKNLEYIEKYAFQNDASICSIPEMPKLDWIAMCAFWGCISLWDIKLPDNMTFIDFTTWSTPKITDFSFSYVEN